MIAWLLVPAAAVLSSPRPAGCGWRSTTLSRRFRGAVCNPLVAGATGQPRPLRHRHFSGYRRLPGGRPRHRRHACRGDRPGGLRLRADLAVAVDAVRRLAVLTALLAIGVTAACRWERSWRWVRSLAILLPASRPGALAAGAVGAPSRPPVRRSGRCPVALVAPLVVAITGHAGRLRPGVPRSLLSSVQHGRNSGEHSTTRWGWRGRSTSNFRRASRSSWPDGDVRAG